MNNNLKKIFVCGATLLSVSTAILPAGQILADTNQTESVSTNSQSSNDANSNNDNKQSSTQTTQQKQLSKPYVVYGAGAQDKAELSKVLGVTDNYTTLTATGQDLATYLGETGTSNSAMISSVSLAPAEPGTGSAVNIVDFNGQNNITQVKAQQYAQVLTMAGVKDVIVTVSANKPVSGTSALTGVYVALAADGIQINSQNAEAANSMIAAQNQAIQDNKNDESYPGKLTAATTQASADLAKQKQKGNDVTEQDVQNALEKALDKQGILDKTSGNAKNQIVNALVNVNNAPISMDKNYIQNANNLVNKLGDSVGNTMASAKDFLNSADAKAFGEEAKGWFTKIIDWIKDKWNALFGNNDEANVENQNLDSTNQNQENSNI